METSTTSDIMCADDVATWLGVDRKTVHNAAARGKSPCQRLGERVLFSRHALVSCEPGSARRMEAISRRALIQSHCYRKQIRIAMDT